MFKLFGISFNNKFECHQRSKKTNDRYLVYFTDLSIILGQCRWFLGPNFTYYKI